MTLKDAIDANKGIGPGFHLLRHGLAMGIVLFHARQLIYWQHGAILVAAAGMTDAGADAQAAASGPVHFTLPDIVRPACHALLGMFFGLSGFLIAGSAVRTATIGRFFANRGLRVFPALAVETLLSAFILGPLVTALPLHAYFTSPELTRYFGNIIGWVYFYLPGVFAHNPLPRLVNGQLWTLPLELACYLATLFCLAIGLLRRPRLVLAIGMSGMLVMIALAFADARDFNVKAQNFYAPWYIVVIFWFGVIFFLNADLIPMKPVLFFAAAMLYWATIFFNRVTPLSGVFLTYCMIYIGFISFPWWERLVRADYSYGLFLYHCPILQAWIYFLGPHWQHVPLIGRLIIVVAVGVPTTLGFAALSWRFVEKPALAFRSVFARTRFVRPTIA